MLTWGAVAGLVAAVFPVSTALAAPSRTFTITTAAVPAAEVATPYAVTLAASGGKTPFTWSVTAGGFPDGVVLAPSTGAVSGSPTDVAVSGDVTVTVTDALGKTASKTFSIAVYPKLVVSTLTLPGAIMGTPYSATVVAAGGSGGYVWSLGAKSSLPNGLTLSAATGVISGTPTAFGTKSFTMVVRDSVGYSASQAMSITVNSDLRITTTSVPVAMATRSYSASLAAAGGRTPYKWALASGSSLPAGLSVGSNGAITGTPTTAAAPSNVTFAVTDATGVTLRKTLSMSVLANLSVATATLPVAMVGETYPSTSLAASGGDGTYTWSLVSGTLPAGMTFAADGTLSGNPTASAAGTSLQFRVTDGNAFTATRSLSLTVYPALSVTTASLPAAVIDSTYPTTTLAASGGDGSYSWAVTSGSLPDGLSLASNGALTGTPSATASTQTVTVTVTDGRSVTATATLSITVYSALTVTTATLSDTMIGDTYSANLAATGGNASYSWALTTGSLPAGLSLAADGTISGTVGAAATSQTFTVTVTDGNNYTATATLSITVYPTLAITTSALPDAQADVTYADTTLAATGGNGTYSWSVTTGSLPDGLSLATDGTISGTTGATATSATFTVTVTDGDGRTTTASLTITVLVPAPAGALLLGVL